MDVLARTSALPDGLSGPAVALAGLVIHALLLIAVACAVWLALRPHLDWRAFLAAVGAWFGFAAAALLAEALGGAALSAFGLQAFVGPFDWAGRVGVIAAAGVVIGAHPGVRAASRRAARAQSVGLPVLALAFAPLVLVMAAALSPLSDAIGFGLAGSFAPDVFVYTAFVGPLAFGLVSWGVLYPLLAGSGLADDVGGSADRARALGAGLFIAAGLALAAGVLVTAGGVLVLKLIIATSFVTGLYLAFLRWLTGALWPPILAQVLLTAALVLA